MPLRFDRLTASAMQTPLALRLSKGAGPGLAPEVPASLWVKAAAGHYLSSQKSLLNSASDRISGLVPFT
jgi:hypothetical protein